MPLGTVICLFRGAGTPDLTDRAISAVDHDCPSVHQRIGDFFMCRVEEQGNGGARDQHLICDLGLRQMLQIVQSQHLVLVMLKSHGIGRFMPDGDELLMARGGANDTGFFRPCHRITPFVLMRRLSVLITLSLTLLLYHSF